MAESTIERVVRLEAMVNSLIEQRREEKDKLNEISKKLDGALDELTKYRGWIGAIVFICGCLFTFIKSWPLIKSFF